jgi:hypothetical protein
MALDYSMILNKPPVGQQIMQGLQQFQQSQAFAADQSRAEQKSQLEAATAERAAQFRTDFGAAKTPQERVALAGQYPEMIETIKSISGMDSEIKQNVIGEISMQMTALSGDPEAAKAYIQENADVFESLGPAFNVERLFQQIETNPEGLVQSADMMAMVALGPEKYQEIMDQRAGRQVTMRGQDVTSQGQQVTMRGQDITARGQNMTQQNSQLAAGSRIEAARIRQEGNGFPDLSVNMEKTLDSAITTATESEAAASRLDSLADQFQASTISGGKRGQLEEFFKEATGSEDFQTELRKQFVQLKNERVINNLPPGVASDRDIEIFMAGYPKDFSNKDYVASFMRGMAKTERAKADLNNFKAEWISQNGNPGQNKSPFEYNGVPIETGVSLKKAYDQYIEVNPPFQVATPGFNGGTPGRTQPASPPTLSGGAKFLGFE